MRRRTNKTDQLRVRLTTEERESLERIVADRNDATTISDVIREGLATYLNPNSQERPCVVSVGTMKTIEKLAVDLNREPQQIIEECIRGIADQL